MELTWCVRSYPLSHTVVLLTRCVLKTSICLDLNKLLTTKSLISRKMMQFLENWSIPSDAKWDTKSYDWVGTEGIQICGNYRDNGLTGHPLYHPVLEWETPKRIPCSGVTPSSLNLLYCIVLYCIVLYCIVLYCIVLYRIVLYCIVLYCIVLYWRQRSCLCFTYLIKWFYHSPLVLSCLCKRILNFLLLLSV